MTPEKLSTPVALTRRVQVFSRFAGATDPFRWRDRPVSLAQRVSVMYRLIYRRAAKRATCASGDVAVNVCIDEHRTDARSDKTWVWPRVAAPRSVSVRGR